MRSKASWRCSGRWRSAPASRGVRWEGPSGRRSLRRRVFVFAPGKGAAFPGLGFCRGGPMCPPAFPQPRIAVIPACAGTKCRDRSRPVPTGSLNDAFDQLSCPHPEQARSRAVSRARTRPMREGSPFDTNAPFSVAFDLRRLLRTRIGGPFQPPRHRLYGAFAPMANFSISLL